MTGSSPVITPVFGGFPSQERRCQTGAISSHIGLSKKKIGFFLDSPVIRLLAKFAFKP
jgi:hypothetical protein